MSLFKTSTFQNVYLCRYTVPEIAVNAGMILRECIRYEPIATNIIKSENFYSLFSYVELSTFDVASDAFSTFKVFHNFIF